MVNKFCTFRQETLFSPHLILRRAVVSCLRQLVQREAAEVSEHALSLATTSDRQSGGMGSGPSGSAGVGVAKLGITETGLEGALFGVLDRDIDRRLCSDVQDTLISLLQSLAATHLTRWLALIKDVLQASSGNCQHLFSPRASGFHTLTFTRFCIKFSNFYVLVMFYSSICDTMLLFMSNS